MRPNINSKKGFLAKIIAALGGIFIDDAASTKGPTGHYPDYRIPYHGKTRKVGLTAKSRQDRSKYQPHQGKQEMARRREQAYCLRNYWPSAFIAGI